MSFLQRILVAVDGSPSSDAAVEFAIGLAREHGAQLVFCNAVNINALTAETTTPYGFTGGADLIEDVEQGSRDILRQAEGRCTAASVGSSGFKLEGRADYAIVSYGVECEADAIVVGTRGGAGLEHLFMGSVAEGVLRTATIPVFVVHAEMQAPNAESHGSLKKILVAVDDSEPSDAAAAFATELAATSRGSLVLAHVIDEEHLYEEMAKYVGLEKPLREEWQAEGNSLVRNAAARAEISGLTVEREVVYGEPVSGLLKIAEAKGVDAIAIGTHGRRGLRRLIMGSVAEGVVRGCSIPVLVLRGHAELAHGRKVFHDGETRAERVKTSS